MNFSRFVSRLSALLISLFTVAFLALAPPLAFGAAADDSAVSDCTGILNSASVDLFKTIFGSGIEQASQHIPYKKQPTPNNSDSINAAQAEVNVAGKVFKPGDKLNLGQFGSYVFLITDQDEIVISDRLAGVSDQNVIWLNSDAPKDALNLSPDSKFLVSHRSLIRRLIEDRKTTKQKSRPKIVGAGEIYVFNWAVVILNNRSGSRRAPASTLKKVQDLLKRVYSIPVPESAIQPFDEMTVFSGHAPAYLIAKTDLLYPKAVEWARAVYQLVYSHFPDPQRPGLVANKWGYFDETLMRGYYDSTSMAEKEIPFRNFYWDTVGLTAMLGLASDPPERLANWAMAQKSHAKRANQFVDVLNYVLKHSGKSFSPLPHLDD